MTPEEAWSQVARECPRRIMAALHKSGEYVHGTTPRSPGKVLCCHRDAPLPAGWTPTPAQQQAGWAIRDQGQTDVTVVLGVPGGAGG
jgi:hypothetical protein